MKFFIVLASVFALLASVSCFHSHETGNDIIDDEMIRTMKRMENNLEFKYDIEEFLKVIKIVQKLSYIEPTDSIRQKRQAVPVNCSELQNKLADTQNQIKLILTKITNSTIIFNTLKNQVASYEQKVATSTGSALKSATNLLATYQKLLNSMYLTFDNLKKQLADLQAKEVQIKNDIQVYCILSTTTTPRPAVSSPCGTFVKFDSINDRRGPELDGFAGGDNPQDSSVTYVAFGNGMTCNNQFLVPCALSTNAISPGCSIPCNANEIFDKSSSFYLQKNPNLVWVPTTSATLSSVPNALKLIGPNNFRFGRAKVNGVYVLGKVNAGGGLFAYQSVTSNGAIEYKSNFEILACFVPCACQNSTTSAPITSTTSSIQTVTPGSDTINPDQSLLPGGSIVSSDGSSLTFDPNGNLILKNGTGHIIYVSNTNGTNATILTMEPNGSLTLKNSAGSIILSTAPYTKMLIPGSSAKVIGGKVIITNGNTISFDTSNVDSTTVRPIPETSSTTTQTAASSTDSTTSAQIQNTTNAVTVTSPQEVTSTLSVPISEPSSSASTQSVPTMEPSTSTTTQSVLTSEPSISSSTQSVSISESSTSTSTQSIPTSEPLTSTSTQSVSISEPSTSIANQTAAPIQNTTTASSTSEIITTSATQTTKFASNYQCGDLLTFIGNDVTQLGLNSGTFYDGSTIYAGTSDFGQCWWQYESPARISKANNFKGPGGYMTCHSFVENYDGKTAKFFANSDGLNWVKTNGSTYNNVPNILKVGYLYVGRINIEMSNGTYQQIGKIYAGNIYYKQPDTGIEKIYNGDFEILACTTCKYANLPGEPCCTNGGRGKFCCLNGADNEDCCLNGGRGQNCCTNGADNKDCVIRQCGYLIDLAGNDPSIDGFSAGKYIDGSTIYAGAGDFNVCWWENPAPARIMTTNSVSGPGAYCPCGGAQPAGENYNAASAQYFYNHPDMKWVPTKASEAATIPGVVKVAGFYVGRKWLASRNGTYQQVGKVKNGLIFYKIPGKTQEFTSDGDIDVLVCMACDNGGSGPFCCLNGATNKECLLEFTCGTTAPFPRYDPNVDGFESGTYQDGSKVFPGTGDFGGCWWQENGPGRILTEFVNNKEPGAYQICGGAPEQFDMNDPRYYLNQTDLVWVQTNGTEAANVPGVIKTGPFNMNVGRFNYITPNGTFQAIGKVHANNLYFYQPGDNGETITGGIFEVLTCKPRSIPSPCGTLLQFTTNDVTTLGFNSGTYYDGSTVYVGTGNMNQCWWQNPSPARITTANSFKGPGAYMQCYSTDNYDEIDVRFFAAHSDLRWVKTNGSFYDKVEGALKVKDLYVGRINIQMNNGTYQQIGKLYAGNIYYRQPDSGQEIVFNGEFEVLACTKCSYQKAADEPCCAGTGRGKYCCTNGANNADCCPNNGRGKFCCTNGADNEGCIEAKCGHLFNFNATKIVENGFEAGKYIDGSTIYAGAGDFNVCWWQNPAPARIMTTNSVSGPGAYCSCGGAQPAGENYNAVNAQYFYNHPDLKWVPTTAAEASKVEGAVKVAGFYVGRKWLASRNGTYQQVGKVTNNLIYYKIPGKTQEFTSDGDIDVLACVPCTNGGSGPFCCLNGATNKECLLEFPCGSTAPFPRYDPNVDGFESGTYQDGSKVFPGTGDFNGCWWQKNGAGRILTEFVSNKEPGAYQICGGAPEQFDLSDPRYYRKHPNLAWVQTTGPEAANVPGVIKTQPNMLVGRFNYITPNGTFQAIGKVHANNLYFYQPGDSGETITGGAFEVLTCQPRQPIVQCGTLLEFTANDISTLGFNSGTYYDGSTVYVGTGNMNQCWWQNPSPARLTLSNSFKGQGAYMQCYSTDNYDEIDPRFFAAHSDLRWVMTNGSSYEKVEGALKVKDLYVGRINVTIANGTYQQIGKLYAGNIYYRQPDSGQEIVFNGEFEILACNPCSYQKAPEDPCCTNGGRGKYCCTNGANNADCCLNGGVGEFCCTNGANNKDCIIKKCGYLIKLNGSDPAVNGFEAGKYIDGSTIYAGIGNFGMCWWQNPAPARIMTTNSVSGPGAYCSCAGAQPAGENYDAVDAQYFYDHEDLKWVPTIPSEAFKVEGAVKVAGFYVGRKFMSSRNGTFIQIGKIENGYFRYKIPGKKDEWVSSGDIDVLACVPCTNGGSGPFCCLNGATNKECMLIQACGTTAPFPRYDPNVDGFWSGTYQDGSKVLPGTGDFNECWWQRNGPGRILTEFVDKKEPGAYQICGGAPERFDMNDPRYFIDHPNMVWVQTNGSEAKNIPGVIKTGDMKHFVGRFNYITSNGTYQAIGKVQDTNLYFYQPGDGSETVTSGTFEVLTCQDRPVNLKCGTLLQFTTNNVTEFGFNSGTYYDGSTVYVGTGNMNQCWWQNPSPARITTANSFKGPGAYMQCYSTDNYDEIDVRFFAAHSDLRWVMTNGSSYEKVEGALKVKDLYVGRINVTIANGTYQQIGKLYAGNIYYRQPDSGQEIVFNGEFEILACNPCSYQKAPEDPCCTNGGRGKYCCTNGANNADCCLNGGVGQYCCTNGANNKGCIIYKCGYLINLNGSDPTIDGFSAGKYIDGSTIYAGAGDFNVCWWQNPAPARIMTTNSVSGPGAYCSCGGAQPAGENYNVVNAQYFYNHPDLKWVPTTAAEASKVEGAVKVAGFYVGRKWLASRNGTYQQVGKVTNNLIYYKIPGKTQEFTSDGDIDVLACVPCTNGGSGPFCCLNGANNKECLLEFPCGTTAPFPRYDPNVDGFESGTYQDGSKVFPGTGDFNGCWWQKNGAGRILTEFVSNKEPGAYQICGGAPEQFDLSDPRYYRKHPNLAWVQTTGPEAENVPGVIKTQPNMLVGRFNYITPNGTFQAIGKVHANNLYFYQPGDSGETITGGAFEVLTCQPRQPIVQCGTLLEFTANDISTLGFNSGTYYDGSTVYVGTGNMNQCWWQNPSPARLTLSNSFKGQGAYMQCYSTDNYDEIDPRFFAAHSDLRWVMTNGSSYEKVEGALKVKDLYVGRINVTIANGTYQQIGKLHAGNIYYRQPDSGQEIIFNGEFEVLACSPCAYQKAPGDPCCTNGGRGKYCCTNGANNADCCLNGGVGQYCCTNGADNEGCIINKCGFLIKLNGGNPSKNGFEAGTYIDGSTIYAGIGNFGMCWGQNPAPARIMTTNSVSGPGAYCSCGGAQPAGENYDAIDAQYFYDHEDLKWVPTIPSEAPKVEGAIKVAGFYVGRKFMSSRNGTYIQIGKIENGYFRYKIPGKKDEWVSSGDIDVLACVPCTNGGSGPFCCLNGATNKECMLIQACGTTAPFPRYDPNVDGFWSGTYQDGSKVLPGTGDFNECWWQRNGPGRILTEFVDNKEPGVYQICGGAPERFDMNDPRYFIDHPNMAWVQTTGAEAKDIPGIIKTGDMKHFVGRFNYIQLNGTYQTIGKVQDTNLYFYKPGDGSETVTSGAFEVLTCQDKPVNIKCGTRLQFATNDINEYGFNSGTYYDGSTVYVGTGNMNQCWWQNPSPARITTATNFKGPGAYMQCGNNVDNYDAIDPRFFAKHSDLRWIMTNGSQYEKVEGGLKVGSLYVGRINITMANGTYQQIGKLHAGNIYYRQPDTGNEVLYNGAFEILACTPCSYQKASEDPCCTNGGRGKYCCTNGADNADCCLNGGTGKFCCTNGADNKGCIIDKCGFLLNLNGNDPAVNGFEAGKYIDGSTIYAGIGNFSMCWWQNPAPARIMTANSVSGPGAYCSCAGAQPAGENYDAASAQYFLNHADLKWVPTTPSQAANVVGAIKVAGFYVGRKFMISANGTYQQVGKIENGYFRHKIPGKTDEHVYSGDIDVLACVPCTNGGSGPFCCTNGANNPTCDLNPPCGTLLSYPRYDPKTEGFASGTYYNGAINYPGTADFSACFGHNPAVARIDLLGSKGSGAYMSCGNFPETYDDLYPKFFKNHPDLKWIPINSAQATTVQGVINIGPWNMNVARKTFTIGNGTFTTLGKIYSNNLYYYIPGNAAETTIVTDVEVLACKKCTNGGTGPYCCTNGATNKDCIIPKPCGTFVKYDIVNGRTDPEKYGVLGGIDYRDGSLQYVGYGNNNNPAPCAGQNPCPGYINTNATAPGIYMSCAHGLFRDTQSVYYLEDHPDLMWVATNSANMMSVPNTIKLAMDQQWPFMFGRTTFNGQLTLGKAHAGNTFFLLNFFTTIEERYLDNFEVLTCTPGNTAPRLPVKPTPATCGDLTKFMPSLSFNNPVNNGFSAGKYIDGSTIYAGIGNFSMCWGQNPAPARIMTTNSVFGPGAYCSCAGAQPAGENYDAASAQYFINHPDLKWVPTTPSQAANVVGAIKVAGFYVGRKFMISANGTYQLIGKIEGGSLKHKIPGRTSEFDYYGDIDVLACVPCTNGGSGPFCCTNGANNPTCELNPPCGTLLSYPRNDPTVDGLPSGNYYNGAVNYPGTADFSACFGHNPAVARIDLFGSKGGGAYMGCGNFPETYDDLYPKYFKNHPDLKWIPINSAQATTVQGVINVGPWNMNVARKTFTIGNGTFTTLGKIYSNNLYYYIPGDAAETTIVTDVEVLACKACTNGGTGPYCCANGANNKFCCANGAENINCCTNGATSQYCCLNGATNPTCSLNLACGSLLPFNGTYSPDDVNNPGFNAGKWLDGGIIYPGSGNFATCSNLNPSPAIIRLNGPNGAGAYQSFSNKPQCYDGTNAQFVYNSPNLGWTSSSFVTAASVLNSVNVGGNKMARINITHSNGTVYQSMGRLILGTLHYYKEGSTSESTSTGPYEILVCK